MRQLKEIAYARSGDKGTSANIGVIAKKSEDYPFLKKYLTKERVKQFFLPLGVKKVVRYELDNLEALNFVLYETLDGGGSQSLRIDSQGKALGVALLEMELEDIS
ncbi:MAG TPA: hypothetical protein PLC42_00650 [Parachlamydiaceae bacterium]|nr:hypothetical protein [Parachlamydiaceae bacterium]